MRTPARREARVGETHEQGHDFEVAPMPTKCVAGSMEMDETRSFTEAIVDADTGEILGPAVPGAEGSARQRRCTTS